jgi:uncharacterized protein YjbI with pentapeptide repeats
MAQDYRRAKLRGKSFKGKDLEGADFSYSDIRGVDFTEANLKGANFSYVKAGLQRRWAIVLILFALLLSALSGFLSAIGGSLVGILLIDSNRENLYVGIVSLFVLVMFFLITIYRGVGAAFGFMAMSVTCAGLAAVGWAGIVAVTWAGGTTSAGAMGLAQIVAVVVTGAVAVVATILGTVVIAGAVTLAGAVAGFFAVTCAICTAAALSGGVAIMATRVNLIAGSVAIAIAVSMIILSSYVALRALFEDEKQNLIRNLALGLATKHGTNFQDSDLSDVDFTRARLKNTNLSKANLTRTCWFEVQKLDVAIVGKSYLNNPKIRQLVIHKDLHNRNFDGWDLQGLNLRGANLVDGSFIGTKFNQADLRGADISRANLTRSQVDKTDFRGATLTGAYIENWGITLETKLEDVNCQYIFMRVPNKDNPNPRRLPANWDEQFQPGEFTQFFSPLSKASNN